MNATGEDTAAAPVAEGSALDLIAPLGGLFAQVASARWAPLLGGGNVAFSGLAAGVEDGAVVGAASIAIGGEQGWVRAALQPGAAAPGGDGDAQAVAAWLEGIGAAVGRLLGGPTTLRPAETAGEGGTPDVPAGTPVLGYAVRTGRGAVQAWCWLDEGILARCLEALASGAEEAPPPRPDPFPPLPEAEPPASGRSLDVLLDVPVQVAVELGRAERQIRDVLALVPGSVVELDRLAGDPLDLLVNGRRIARGEAVVVDERFALRITEILAAEEHTAPD